ncbi:MAG: hypothetical protein GYB67_03850, partial [Chloroflexi bacterium]|nr:hypothetical protein [Chloroflexota bacterium]
PPVVGYWGVPGMNAASLAATPPPLMVPAQSPPTPTPLPPASAPIVVPPELPHDLLSGAAAP